MVVGLILPSDLEILKRQGTQFALRTALLSTLGAAVVPTAVSVGIKMTGPLKDTLVQMANDPNWKTNPWLGKFMEKVLECKDVPESQFSQELLRALGYDSCWALSRVVLRSIVHAIKDGAVMMAKRTAALVATDAALTHIVNTADQRHGLSLATNFILFNCGVANFARMIKFQSPMFRHSLIEANDFGNTCNQLWATSASIVRIVPKIVLFGLSWNQALVNPDVPCVRSEEFMEITALATPVDLLKWQLGLEVPAIMIDGFAHAFFALKSFLYPRDFGPKKAVDAHKEAEKKDGIVFKPTLKDRVVNLWATLRTDNYKFFYVQVALNCGRMMAVYYAAKYCDRLPSLLVVFDERRGCAYAWASVTNSVLGFFNAPIKNTILKFLL